jgi:hypothetical protein
MPTPSNPVQRWVAVAYPTSTDPGDDPIVEMVRWTCPTGGYVEAADYEVLERDLEAAHESENRHVMATVELRVQIAALTEERVRFAGADHVSVHLGLLDRAQKAEESNRKLVAALREGQRVCDVCLADDVIDDYWRTCISDIKGTLALPAQTLPGEAV